MYRKSFYFLIFSLFLFFLSPRVFALDNFSGSVSYYTNYSYDYRYDGGGVPTSYTNILNSTFPTQNYVSLVKVSNYQANLIKELDLTNSNYNFKSSHTYTIKLYFNFGSYMRFSYNLWGISEKRDVTYCPNGSCSISWEDDMTNAQSVATILYTSTSDHTGVTFAIGSIGSPNTAFITNISPDYSQGIRIYSSTIQENEQNIDLSPIVNAQNQTTNAVNNNTNAVNNINNTLNDSTITADADADFFDNINLYEDNTLSGIITAPLTFLRSIDGTCQPVSLTYKGQVITLPCGDTIFWGRNDVSSFRTFWNILFGGYIIYRLCFKLFKTINDALDPTKDDIGGVAV